MIPATFFSIHLIDSITASPGVSLGEPIVLTIASGHNKTQVTLFFRNGDADYTERLIAAINSVERRPAPPDAAHAAAHDAANAIYGRDAL